MSGRVAKNNTLLAAALWRGAAACAALALASCGEPLVTGDYLGEPLIELSGRIVTDTSTLMTEESTLRVAVFWSQDQPGAQLERVAHRATEQQVVTRTAFPARYSVTLYSPPDDAVLSDVPSGSGRLGVALLLVYADLDEDGSYGSEADQLVGGTGQYVLAYAPAEVRSPIVGGRLSAGYHLMQFGGDAGCLQDARLALMRSVDDRTAEVDLTVTQDLDGVLPDVDCDGFVDVCSPLLDALPTAPIEVQEELLNRWRECVALTRGAPPCSDLLALLERGQPIPAAWQPYADGCREDPEGSPPFEEICWRLLDRSLDLCALAGLCVEERQRRLVEVCLSPEAQRACEPQLRDALEQPEPAAWAPPLIDCLASVQPEGPGDPCQAAAAAACEPLIARWSDAAEIPDAVWFDFERCIAEQVEACQGMNGPPGACEPLREEATRCPDEMCFSRALEALRACSGGVLQPEDRWLCEWWLWPHEGCDPPSCTANPERAHAACLSMFNAMP